MGKPESEMTAEQIAHKRAQCLAWRRKHRAHLRRYSKEWVRKHPGAYRKYMRRYYAQPGKRAAMNARMALLKRTQGRNAKARLVAALGGKCSRCGYCKCISALDFHHIARSQKRFPLSGKSLIELSFAQLLREAKKCALVCANCHREIHAQEDSFSMRGLSLPPRRGDRWAAYQTQRS